MSPNVKVLLDECLDRRLAKRLVGHVVQTVRQAGWAAYTNGQLLARAASEFDVFITFDCNLPHQQNLMNYSLAVIILRARTNNIVDLAPLVPKLPATLPTAPKGEATVFGP